MHYQISFLIILPLISAHLPLHLFIRKLKNRLNVASDNADVYHDPYSEELQDARYRAHDT